MRRAAWHSPGDLIAGMLQIAGKYPGLPGPPAFPPAGQKGERAVQQTTTGLLDLREANLSKRGEIG